MAPDSLALVWVTIITAVLAATATALLWDRARRWWAWLLRPVAVLLCLVTAVAAAAAVLNRNIEFYGSWDELLGTPPPLADPVLQSAGDQTSQVAGLTPPAAGSDTPLAQPAARGRIVGFTVRGGASGITLPAYAYLPAGYDGARLRRQRLPVLEAFDGFPGSPTTWLRALLAPAYLDHEIQSGRMAPTVVIFPYQTTSSTHDTECVNAVGGQAFDTFLTTDVPATVERLFRVRTDAAGWGLIGYSAGAFCAVNLAMRHPDKFAAAASLSGYFQPYSDPMTGDLFRNDPTARDLNSPLWRLQNLAAPKVSLYLAAALDDRGVYAGMRAFAAAVKPPLDVHVVTVPIGGHSRKVWRELQAPAYDWLSAHLAGPLG